MTAKELIAHTGKSLVIHTGDRDIAQMLVENNVEMNRPKPPNDLATTQIRSNGFVWLVFRFFDPKDPGYVAYGLPECTPDTERIAVFRFLLESLRESAAARGIDAFAQSEFIELPALSSN